MAVAHRDKDRRIILDALRERKPPFNPEAVVAEYAGLLRSYHVSRVVGDHYGGEWPVESFRKAGIAYEQSAAPKSDLYRDLLPFLNGGRVELLDSPRLISQLCSLERRTARSGRDSIDHAPGGHDDVANACAGAITLAALKPGAIEVSDEALEALARAFPGRRRDPWRDMRPRQPQPDFYR